METGSLCPDPEGNWLLPNSWQLTFWAVVECRKAKHTNQPLMYIRLVFLKITFRFNKQGDLRNEDLSPKIWEKWAALFFYSVSSLLSCCATQSLKVKGDLG